VLTRALRVAGRSVTDKDALAATSDLTIRIKGDKDSRTLVIEGAQPSWAVAPFAYAASHTLSRRHRHRHD
jgi:hypothetical protein